MAELDLYDLLAGGEPSAREQAALMAQRIRGRSGLGELALLTGDPVLGRFGQALTQRGAGDQELLANALTGRAQRDFQGRGEMEPAGDALRQVGLRFRLNLPADMPTRKAKEALDYAEKAYAAEQRGNELALNREAMRSARDDKLLDHQVELLSKRLETAPALKTDLERLRKSAAQKDIPGVGPIAGRLPSFLLSTEGVQTRQAVKGIVGNLIKERSGTAASDKEVERIMEELGMGDGATEGQFRAGLERLQKQSEEVMRAKEAGARPEAVEEARRRGLVTSKDLAPPAPPATPTTIRVTNGSEVLEIPAEDLAEAEKDGFRRVE